MTVETATYINQLDITLPVVGGPVSEGDDHLRLIKSVLQSTFPSVSGAVTATQAELNILDGVTATAAELNILDGVTATAAELNILDGVTATSAELNILDGVTATAAELNILDGVTATAAEINKLDEDTAVGTFTPGIADAASGGNAGTATTAAGHYIRMGKLIIFSINLVDINTAGMTAGNDLYITGLPVAAANTYPKPCATVITGTNFAADSYIQAEVTNASTVLLLREITKAAALDNVIVSEVTSGGTDIRINGMYFSA